VTGVSATIAELEPHSRTPCNAVRRIAVTVEPGPIRGELRIRFRIEGDVERLRLPLPEIARRRDGLWQHTCFEAFLQPDASHAYYEFNFAPSGDWAAYRFGGRRSERSLPDVPAPPIGFARHARHCEMTADLAVTALQELSGASPIRAGLATVVETTDGALSYWALAHPGDAPDFHDPASFGLRVTLP